MRVGGWAKHRADDLDARVLAALAERPDSCYFLSRRVHARAARLFRSLARLERAGTVGSVWLGERRVYHLRTEEHR